MELIPSSLMIKPVSQVEWGKTNSNTPGQRKLTDGGQEIHSNTELRHLGQCGSQAVSMKKMDNVSMIINILEVGCEEKSGGWKFKSINLFLVERNHDMLSKTGQLERDLIPQKPVTDFPFLSSIRKNNQPRVSWSKEVNLKRILGHFQATRLGRGLQSN